MALIVQKFGGTSVGDVERIQNVARRVGTDFVTEEFRGPVVGVEANVEDIAAVFREDAAAAVAWTFNHIKEYGGSPDKIFVTGHSAGGYLASMVGLDKEYLKKFNIDADKIAGLIPLSGHSITHFTIRKEMGIAGTQPVVDKYAPLFHVRKDAPPILLITGNREKEMLGRYEEVAYLYRMFKVVGHEDVELMEMDGYGHNMVYPAIPPLLDFVRARIE